MNPATHQLQLLAEQPTPPPVLLCGERFHCQELARGAADAWGHEPRRDFSDLQLVMSQEPGEGQLSARALLAMLAVAPPGRQVVLLDLEGAGGEVQNALLKRLEEPPAHTWVIASARRPAAILPTVRSRCALLRVPPLSAQQLAQRAADAGLEVSAALCAAAGSWPQLCWMADHPELVQAAQAGDGPALLQALKESDQPAVLVSRLLSLMDGGGAGQQLLARGARPEAALARALLG